MHLLPSFFPLLADLANVDICDMLRALDSDPKTAQWRKVGKREALRRRAAVWSPRRKTSSTFWILRPDGNAASSHEEAASLLRSHWAPVFREPDYDAEAATEILQCVQLAPSDFDWDFTFDSFATILHRMPDSAPGPDGIPYSAWARAENAITQQLFHY
jgi:hypothetical protein